MGRSSYSSRGIIEYSAGISIQDLKKAGFFNGKNCTGTWKFTLTKKGFGHVETLAEVTASVKMDGDNSYICFVFNSKGNEVTQKHDIERQPVKFGGYRYFFKCGCFKRGIYCGHLVKTLYWGGHLFACRHCLELVYNASRMHRDKCEYIRRSEDLDKRAERYKRNGHPRKAARLYWTARRYEQQSWIALAGQVDRLKKRAGL